MLQRQLVTNNIELLLSDTILPITEDWFSADYWQSRNELVGTATGRGTVWFIENNYGAFVLRKYRRGGLIAKLLKFRFFFKNMEKTRVFQELTLLEYMVEKGLPVPRAIAGKVNQYNGFYEAFILIETLKEAKELFHLLRANKAVHWYSIGQTIKRFHEEGIYHSDLNCHNIMIDQTQKIWLIDFDKCDQRPQNDEWQNSNLQRLLRSLEKENDLHNDIHFNEHHWAQLLEGYHGKTEKN
ncbi:3-deoxy-D-manno-octulosonic acid kinase [Marinomonas sp. 15G1-11]|uniref:3-deoxy-D-manno-octulosonic acid kinase n=1 Tax=Marinomonas phaeophyticola TaxID=3004091 RepID=A0ABT4JXJ2_9GAMM|nr:3-deoxy-D-manno-octulosonic acid kinase [Marinomonas sp. 15G1-11]MCZ2722777.1 3-deoxy-D-manno-octulosonic acid kinase [Marinomonas sp. 15G1-11]